uniref:Variant surface glycoprotein 1125.406 n=1 Tax=Trypanosoma brucei TaxID=5691 RepID=A0A1J0R5U0_9TRYP|nr:variant surface glycoprotein 1125.406 [Trypanosoma brucei]
MCSNCGLPATKAPALLALTISASSTHVALLNTELTKACALSAELKAVTKNAVHVLETHQGTTQKLTNLQQDLVAMVVNEKTTAAKEATLIARLARQKAEAAAEAFESAAISALKASASAAYLAGQITEGARPFLTAGDGSELGCVAKTTTGTKEKKATTYRGCDVPSSVAATLETAAEKAEINVEQKFKAISGGASTVSSGATTCVMLHHSGATTGGTQALTYLAGLITTGNLVNNAPTWNVGADKWAAAAKSFGAVHSARKFDSQLTSFQQEIKVMLNLADLEESDPEELKIEVATFGDKDSATEQTIDVPALNRIKADLKKYRTGHEIKGIERAREDFFKEKMKVNKTVCDLRAKLSAKQDCEVTKIGPQKCEGKEQEDCRNTNGCEWKDRTCKLTDTDQKEAAKEREKAGGNDGKPEEKCAKHGNNKQACAKDNNCKYENNACKDSSFLSNKKLALTDAAAFMSMVAF